MFNPYGNGRFEGDTGSNFKQLEVPKLFEISNAAGLARSLKSTFAK